MSFVIDGKGKDTAKNAEEGTIPLIIAKKNNNGVGKLIKNPRKVFSGNKLAVVSQGDGGSGM
ncbi:MAG: hypothetical protein LBD88_04200, partial [Candidatus Peribacteria bacterium]|nr:hypothetical protein [Candidatus Peribacteria bacterium]